MQVNKNKSLIN